MSMGAASRYVRIKGGKGVIKMQTHTNKIGAVVSGHGNVRASFFLTEYLVHKLFTIITRSSDGFVILVLLKRYVLKRLYFTVNFQPITNATKNSILHAVQDSRYDTGKTLCLCFWIFLCWCIVQSVVYFFFYKIVDIDRRSNWSCIKQI